MIAAVRIAVVDVVSGATRSGTGSVIVGKVDGATRKQAATGFHAPSSEADRNESMGTFRTLYESRTLLAGKGLFTVPLASRIQIFFSVCVILNVRVHPIYIVSAI